MNSWINKQYNRWAITRRKGRLHYVVKHTLIAAGAVLLGSFLGFMLFDKIRNWSEFSIDFSIAAVAFLVFGLVINHIIWIVAEIFYEKEFAKRERT
ncbi:hypothetical protein ERW49_18355 [Aliivibrio finisterrensis]|uniref:Uncharacterized protein n=1 Tax=Aliivibrio finisterrensis TaxID=511998 RepID=A0A4Q5KBE9_9GAMM|nr:MULTISPECIES: hypothetical protein [Aliivibrio]MDD9174007.1 hypothetical protein [Aliivibrio sp. S3TY1]MDD9191084.1 hypothetical protein [Aliivibrio sp. S2TY2]RYU42132.1 hypothetical protein ERW49_18355 [Aliivibrio finisterrensis]